MTESEETGSVAPRHPETLPILLPMGLWFDLPDTWANRRGAMIVLRGVHRRDGWPWVTSEHLAHALGSADRRHVHHFWAECEAGGRDLAALFPRRQQGDAEVVARWEPRGKAPPFWTCAQVLAECRRRWPASGVPLHAPHMRTAGHQVGVGARQQVLRRPLAEGDAPEQEPVVWEAWFDLATASAQAQVAEALPVLCLPHQRASVSPAGAEQAPLAPPADASVAVLEDALLQGQGAPSTLAQRWDGVTGAVVVACILSDHGVSLEGIGRFVGVHTTTVRHWLSPLAQGNWQGAGQHGRRWCAGTVAVEDQWSTIAGVWWSRFVAVEHVAGLPLHVALLPSTATPSCARFRLQRKARG